MYKKILVPLDGSNLAECVLPHVETALRACKSPEVIFVQVVEPIHVPYGRDLAKVTSMQELERLEARHRVEGEDYLQTIAAGFHKTGVKTRTEIMNGEPAAAITDYAKRNDVDLVIIATHGRSGVGRWVRGSVADRLLRSLCVPVLMVRAPGCPAGI